MFSKNFYVSDVCVFHFQNSFVPDIYKNVPVMKYLKLAGDNAIKLREAIERNWTKFVRVAGNRDKSRTWYSNQNLTARRRVLKKLLMVWLVKKLMFVVAFTRVRHRILSWAIWIHSKPPHRVLIHFVITLPTMLCLPFKFLRLNFCMDS